MGKLFWIALGAAGGVYAVHRVGQAVEAYTPAGLGRSAQGVAEGLRELAAAIREGMQQREEELRTALGVVDPPTDPGTRPVQTLQND